MATGLRIYDKQGRIQVDSADRTALLLGKIDSIYINFNKKTFDLPDFAKGYRDLIVTINHRDNINKGIAAVESLTLSNYTIVGYSDLWVFVEDEADWLSKPPNIYISIMFYRS